MKGAADSPEPEAVAAARSPPVAASVPRRLLGAALGFWRVLRANPLSLAGFVLVVLIAITAVLVLVAPGAIGVHYPLNNPGPDPNSPPSWSHPFGTDEIGIDIYSNVLGALPVDLFIAFAITSFALVVGGLLGLLSGYWDRPWSLGGAVSTTVLRVTDIFLSFPSLILALAIAASLGRGVFQAIVAIMATWWPYYVRLVRGEVLAVKHQLYVAAARAAGVSEVRILFRHVLRNVLEPTVVYFTMDIGTVLVVFSTISFVGVGVPFPSAHISEWGSMIEYYQDGLLVRPWEVLAPGLAVFVTVLAFSLLGDGLRDVLDPRSRRSTLQAGAASAGAEATEGSEAEAPPVGGATGEATA
jgi:peptide/nickel transport system permease protein